MSQHQTRDTLVTVVSYNSECNTKSLSHLLCFYYLFSLGASCVGQSSTHGGSEYWHSLCLSLWTVSGGSAPFYSHQGVPPNKHWCSSGAAASHWSRHFFRAPFIFPSQVCVIPAEVIAKSLTVRMLIHHNGTMPSQNTDCVYTWRIVFLSFSLRGGIRIVVVQPSQGEDWIRVCVWSNEWSVWCYLLTKTHPVFYTAVIHLWAWIYSL